jgi:hypothetical protein
VRRRESRRCRCRCRCRCRRWTGPRRSCRFGPGCPEKAAHDYVRHGTTTLFAGRSVCHLRRLSANPIGDYLEAARSSPAYRCFRRRLSCDRRRRDGLRSRNPWLLSAAQACWPAPPRLSEHVPFHAQPPDLLHHSLRPVLRNPATCRLTPLHRAVLVGATHRDCRCALSVRGEVNPTLLAQPGTAARPGREGLRRDAANAETEGMTIALHQLGQPEITVTGLGQPDEPMLTPWLGEPSAVSCS